MYVGVERTEKICVGSGIRCASLDQDRTGFTRCGLDKLSSIISCLFKEIYWDNWLFGQQFSELWHHEDCAHKKMAQFLWNKQLSLISGPWHSIRSGISGRVLLTYYLTCPGRVFVPPPYVCDIKLLDFLLFLVFNLVKLAVKLET